jgi:hypothetical protein
VANPESVSSGHHQATPFTVWLRVPLEWYQSATFAQFPDENPSAIRRTFESAFHQNTRRQFCGYCGTPLSSWNERTPEEADFISLTLGSLIDEDLGLLEKLGILPEDDPQGEEDFGETSQGSVIAQPVRPLALRGAPWFESLVEDSSLGRIKRKRGTHTSQDGTVHVEWEIMEWNDNDDEELSSSTTGKRKLDDVDREAPDVSMRQS